MIHRRINRIFAVALVLVVFTSPLSFTTSATTQGDDPAYTVTDLGSIKDYPNTSAYGINDEGVVVGQSTDPTTYAAGRAVIFRNGKLRAIVKGEKGTSTASDVNNALQIAGYSGELNGPPHALIWKGDEVTEIGTLGGDQSVAMAINEAGAVAGVAALVPGDFEQHAFLWIDGEMLDLGTLGEGEFSGAQGINEANAVVGSSATEAPDANGQSPQHAVLWQDGEITDLGVIGGPSSNAADINSNGLIVGISTTDDDQYLFGVGSRAVLWQDGEIVDLGTLGEGERSAAEAINDAGVIVGSSAVAAGEPSGAPGENHAFVWIDGKMTDLNTLIADEGWVLEQAYDINATGMIVGVGRLDGEPHAYLLTPVEA